MPELVLFCFPDGNVSCNNCIETRLKNQRKTYMMKYVDE